MTTKHSKRRTAFTTHLTIAINKLDEQLKDEVADEVKITALIEQVQSKFKKVEDISDIIQDELDDALLEADIEKMDILENQVIEVKVRARSALEQLRKKSDYVKKEELAVPQTSKINAKLPDATLQEFHGDIESYPSFIDNFNSLVDNNPELSDDLKFSYLRGAVKVDCINNYPLTAQNYKFALAKLKETYGDESLIATKHLNSLLDMSKRKKPTDNKELQEFFNFLETKLTCLEALNKPVDQKNQMLITLIYRQLPKKLKTKIAQLDSLHSTVKAVMDIISQHIKTTRQMDFREESDDSDEDLYSYNKRDPTHKPKLLQFVQGSDEEDNQPISSAAALPVLTQSRQPCPYCNNNHSPSYCQNVTNVDQRREILRTSNKCFNCLRTGHRASDCRNPGRCRQCQRKHHSSLCIQRQKFRSSEGQHIDYRNSPSNSQGQQFRSNDRQHAESRRLPSQSNYQGLTTSSSWEPARSVLLQMAAADIRKPNGQKYLPANIFFDLGSQWSYTTKLVKNSLDLDTIQKDVLEVNTFGRTDSVVSTSDVVTLQIVKGDFTKEVTLHTTDSICNPLPSYKISKRKLGELGGIKLASPTCKYEGSHDISLLIGADLYWELVETESKCTSWGVRAVRSKLGWLLSGPVSNDTSQITAVHCVQTKILQTMRLDKVAVNKGWINTILSTTPKRKYLGNLETIHDKMHVHKFNKKPPVSVISAMPALAIRDNYQEINLHQDYKEIEEVDDWFKYKVQSSMTSNDINLRWFWDTEHIGILPEHMEPSVLEQFQQRVKYLDHLKRYEVELPCKMKLLESLPDNQHICEIRLQSLLKKLNKPANKEILQCYDDILTNQLKEGVIEEVNTDGSTAAVVHYLPHHCVIHKEKQSSPVRVVMDGSAKENKTSLSLNQCLHAGPSLVNNLAAVLLRFRMFQIGVVADIKKAFLQLSLAEDDRDLTRFLWRKDGSWNNPIKVYRFARVPFGLTSSPFLLHATIIHHLEKHGKLYPHTISKLLTSFYVDDLVTGTDTEEEAIELVNEGDTVMKAGSMMLNKWNTNSPNVLKRCSVPEAEESPRNSKIKVLGITWNTQSDQLEYNVKNTVELLGRLKPSKRTILKIVQKIYDPLGLLSAYLITAKVLLQRLCKLKLGWDEFLPGDILKEWMKWTSDLDTLMHFTIPRCVKPCSNSTLELAGFCDASKSAYAAVVYLRCANRKKVKTNFLIAKSRVAPMKNLTIPRLELLGAVLLVRLVSTVQECLSPWEFSRITYYTDSMNVLFWIKGAKKWNQYISKRLDEINTLSSKSNWQHCSGGENPADFPTRGLTMEQLSSSQEWLSGPRWLSELTFQPNRGNCQIMPSEDCLNEEKAVHTYLVADAEKTGLDKIIHLERYSSFKKICRIMSFILLFIKHCMGMKEVSYLDMQQEAENKLITNEQRKYYSELLPYLKGEVSKPVTSVAKQLDLFIDADGLIRCSGRYKYATLSYRRKYPILLPKESYLTTLIIEDRHKRVKHAGVKTSLTEIREEYWIPRGRRMVKSIISKCVICRRLNAKPFKSPGPPPLPEIRLSNMPPFTNTGVDFAGPLYCRERGSSEAYKAYIALYTCASTRAVNLELVPDLTTHSFKNSMIRFVSNRGIPNVMISDNAKTFKKAAGDLNCLITRSPTQEFIQDNRITWLFYLEKSPWWGGFIERMVGSVKSILRKCLYRSFMSYDEMTTLLKQIESVVNSRPITYIYDDDIEEPLTPSHLLMGRRSTQLPTPSQNTYDAEGRNIYRERMLTQFERKWKDVYLSELQDYHITTQRSNGVESVPEVGEVVIMKEDSPRGSWKLARVVQLHKGKDGKIRSIEVIKPNKRSARRPPQLLVPLESKLYK